MRVWLKWTHELGLQLCFAAADAVPSAQVLWRTASKERERGGGGVPRRSESLITWYRPSDIDVDGALAVSLNRRQESSGTPPSTSEENTEVVESSSQPQEHRGRQKSSDSELVVLLLSVVLLLLPQLLCWTQFVSECCRLLAALDSSVFGDSSSPLALALVSVIGLSSPAAGGPTPGGACCTSIHLTETLLAQDEQEVGRPQEAQWNDSRRWMRKLQPLAQECSGGL